MKLWAVQKAGRLPRTSSCLLDRCDRKEQPERLLGDMGKAVLRIEASCIFVDCVNNHTLHANSFGRGYHCIQGMHEKVFAETLALVVLVNGESCQEHCGYIPWKSLAGHSVSFY